MTRTELLEKARKTVCGDREQDYGSPENSFQRIAELWGAYLNQEICDIDVAAMMILLKVARVAEGHAKDDNWIDIAGYAACGAEIESGGEPEAECNHCETVHNETCKRVAPNCLCNTCKHDNENDGCCFDPRYAENDPGHAGGCGGIIRCERYEKEELS